MSKMTPRTLSGFMDLLAQRSLSSSGGPVIEFQSSGVNPADCKVFAKGENACTPHLGRSGQQLPASYQQRSFPPCPK